MDDGKPKVDLEKISKYFTWKEALWLPKENRIANVTELSPAIINQLTDTFEIMDLIRDFFNSPITIHSAFRPPAYNRKVGGTPDSMHMRGMAVDFSVKGIACDDAREKILQKDLLHSLKIRMEYRPKSNWIHIDTKQPPVGGKRYFTP